MKKKSKIDIPPNSELHGGNPGITVVPNDIKNRWGYIILGDELFETLHGGQKKQ